MDYSGDSLRFSWIAAACISFYGLGSWIVVNGVWVELPVLVNYLPEGWNLPAYLSVLIQIANLGPLIYVPLTKLCHTKGHSFWSRCLQPPERLANYTILTVGLLSCVLLAHLWSAVGPLPGKTNTTHSIGLLTLALFAAVVDCTSSVTFVAYLSGLPETYVGALTFGEAFSDLLPSLIALIQGVGEAPECVNVTVNGTSTLVPHYPPPRFSVTVFMYSLAMLLLLSLVAFFLLDSCSWGLGQTIRHRYLTRTIRSSTLFPVNATNTDDAALSSSACSKLSVKTNASSRSRGDSRENSVIEKDPTVNFAPAQSREVLADSSEPIIVTVPTTLIDSRYAKIGLQTGEFVLAIILLAYASLLTNGFLPAFQSYSSASYNNLTYHLAVTLSGVVCAVVTVVATYLVHRSKLTQSVRTHGSDLVGDRTHGGTDWATASYVSRTQMAWLLIAGLASVPACHVIFLATTSPNPPSLDGFGPILAVMSWILLRAGFSGLRTWLWLHLSSRSDEPMALRYAGLATQIGAALGAIASFLLVVQFQLFQPKYPC